MSSENRRKWIWHVASTWIKEESYSLIESDKEASTYGDEAVHLIKNVNGTWHYIRITSVDYMWPQQVGRDMAESAQNMLKNKARLNNQPVHALYLYVFHQSPPEDVKEQIASRFNANHNYKFSFGWVDLEKGNYSLDTVLFPVQTEPIHRALTTPTELIPDAEESQQEIHLVEEEREKRRNQWMKRAKPRWTYVILGMNTIMFLLLSFYGSQDGTYNFLNGSMNLDTLIQFGAKSAYHIVQGEWWRLITPVFLHIGIMHFLFNSIALLSLGSLVERVYGSARFLALYFLSGIAGNIASFLFSDAPGAGASGAIFGTLGAIIYFVLHSKADWSKALGRDVVLILTVNILIGMFYPSIDNYAHLGGLVGGFLMAVLLGLPHRSWRSMQAVLAGVVLFSFVIGGYVYGMETGKDSVAYMTYDLQMAYEKHDYTTAEKILENLVEQRPNEVKYRFQLGVTYLQNGKWDQAERSLLKVIELDPEHTDGWYLLGALSYEQGDKVKAKEYLRKVLDIDPGYTKAKELLEEIS